MESVIFWLIVIGNGIWTFQWIFNVRRSIGHKTMIIPILLLWTMIIYFYKIPELSRYHMLWISPVIIVLEMIVSAAVYIIIRRN